MDIFAKVTVLGEGVRGSLSKQLIADFELDGMNPQTFETGVKELWRIDPKKHRPGRVVHGLGIPQLFDGFHGMWLYDMQDNLVSFGFVTMLDSENPNCDPHLAAQKFKTNPYMKWLLEGGELVKYGAKCIPTGGLYSMPRLYVNGALLIGDAASFCNAEKLSGIHLAIKSGMMAADTIVDALAQDDFSVTTLGGYTERYRESWAFKEHWATRHFHQSTDRGLPFFLLNEPFRQLTGGRGLIDNMESGAGHLHMKRLDDLPKSKREKEEFEFDNVLTFSKEHLVQYSGTQHEADQPSHLVVADTDLCSTTCAEEFGNPCENFCPAIRARISAPPRSTKWFPMSNSPVPRNSSSTTRTASTARPATSPTPTRSSPGLHPREEKDPTTNRCNLPAQTCRGYSLSATGCPDSSVIL